MIAGPEQKSLSSSTRAFLWFTSREVLRVAREDEEEGRPTAALATLERLVGKLLSEGLHDLESAEDEGASPSSFPGCSRTRAGHYSGHRAAPPGSVLVAGNGGPALPETGRRSRQGRAHDLNPSPFASCCQGPFHPGKTGGVGVPPARGGRTSVT